MNNKNYLVVICTKKIIIAIMVAIWNLKSVEAVIKIICYIE